VPKTVAELSGLIELISGRLESTRQEVADLWASNEKLTEQFQAADREAAKLREEVSHLRRQLDEVREAARVQDRVNADLRQENALLKQRLDDHLKRVETWDTRRWGFIVAVVVALFSPALSLASGLIVTLARK
jgi:chromosome segregation ATPase